jgi:hypothetical protein
MAFGLHEGSELNIARVVDVDTPLTFGCELIVSPIPIQCWLSACRLGIRLTDLPYALATATEFLRNEQINILLGECCSTYQRSAHWDAICDIALTPGFAALRDVRQRDYSQAMRRFLDTLTDKFAAYMEEPANTFAFLHGNAKYVQFAPLSGLNDSSFTCNHELGVVLEHRAGAVELPERIANEVSIQCHLPSRVLPEYAMITGDTEQRYMRILFFRDYEQMFRAVVDDDLGDFAAGGIGLLNQVLKALPPEINLIHTSNYIFAKREKVAKGRIMLTGHWNLPDMEAAVPEAKHAYMQNTFKERIESLPIQDLDGRTHTSTLQLIDFSNPESIYPRIFISYSTGRETEKLHYLMTALLQHQFEPVLGTDSGLQAQVGDRPVPADVLQAAFQAIPSCVALISLQIRREDFKFVDPNGGQTRYVLPPWAVAEEVYAWSANVGMLIRLRDEAVEDPRYNKNTLTKVFRNNDSYEKAVADIIVELNDFRQKPRFQQVRLAARRAQFRSFYSPADH